MVVWLPFFLAVVLGVAILYVPGYLMLRIGGQARPDACCLAPAVGGTLVGLLTFAYEPLSIHANVLSLLLAPMALFLLLYVLQVRRRRWSKPYRSVLDVKTVALYAALGFVVGMIVLVKALDGPSSYFLGWDAVRHVNGVQAYAESGNMSALSSTVYETVNDARFAPTTSKGWFYPSNWYVLAALLAQTFGHTSVMAVNVCNFLFASLVYPTSMALFISRVFPQDKKAVVAGAFLTLCSTTFPWMFYAYGPLYPNTAAMALLPAVAAAWVDVVGYEGSFSLKPISIVIAFLAAVGMVLAHPNALFSLAVVGLVFIAHRLYEHDDPIRLGGHIELAPKVCAAVFSLAFCALWVGASQLPFMRGVTGYDWSTFSTVPKMLVNIATMAYTRGWVPAVGAQPLMAVLLIVGAVQCLRERESCWPVALYLVVCFMLLVGATTEGFVKNALIGFWYNDHNRVAAMCALFGTPLVAKGLAMVWDGSLQLLSNSHKAVIHKEKVHVALGVLAMVLALLPVAFVPGKGVVKTAFGLMYDQLELNQDPNYGPLHWDERDFMKEVMLLVPDGAMVANAPFDGSIATYGAYDLHVLYRNMSGVPGPTEREESKLVRTSLNTLASNDVVRAAAQSLGIEYVLQLHTDNVAAMYPGAVDASAEENWTGIYAITPDTPGFELLASQDDLALYRVVY